MSTPIQVEALTAGVPDGRGTRRLLDNVDLSLQTGEFVAVMGRSGSGKTTLLRLLAGIITPDAGTIRVCGVDIATLKARQRAAHRKRSIAYMFQEYNLITTLTVLENVLLPLGIGGKRIRSEDRRTALEALDRFGMAALANRFPAQLSGGEQQRVALVRAALDHRPVLLADEPTGALDEDAALDVLALLRELAAAGMTCLMATHNGVMAAGADRVVSLVNARLEDGVLDRRTANF